MTSERGAAGWGWTLLLYLVLSVPLNACGTSTSEPIEVPLSEFPCQSFNPDGVWESHPLPPLSVGDCTWFLFEDNATYVFEHPLGRIPFDVGGSLISFNEDGTGSTIPSGDVFLVTAADDSTITVRNGQNQAFFLRLALQ